MLLVRLSSVPSILINKYKEIAIGKPRLATKLTISSIKSPHYLHMHLDDDF